MEQALAAIKIKAFRDDLCGPAPLGQPVRHHPHALVNVHLKGVFFLIQRLLPLMNDGGRILNLSSGLARFALPGYAAMRP
jgi:NAD(P)-dependent dehydrogenase (short-subunit alcohol dehydrogenase family)